MSHPIRPRISVVVPVYNGALTVRLLCERLEPVLESVADEWEVVLVEDGSADESWSSIQAVASQDPRVRGIRMSRNYGQHNALLCGVREARHELTVTLDDDLQNPPEEIPKLLAALGDRVDCVYGYPERERHGLLRDIASRATKLALSRAMSSHVAERVGPFRAFRTSLRDGFERYDAPYVNLDVLLTWSTQCFVVVPVEHAERLAGTSNYTLRRLIAHALNMITGFTVIPLQIASVAGLLFSLLGGVALVYVLARYLIEGRVVPGFAFLACSVAVFSGVQLLALGVMGEYLARMHFRIMRRPAYTIRERATADNAERR